MEIRKKSSTAPTYHHPSTKSKIHFHHHQQQRNNHRNILTEPTLEVPLKNHCGNAKDEHGSCRRRTIQFNSVVQMKPIPSHLDYSDRVKKFLWSNRHEIHLNSQRNIREFAFEGWNVHYVLEEENMFYDQRKAEFVHPAHLGGYW
jgi:hypothetical protein